MAMPQSYSAITSDYSDPSPRARGGCFRRFCCGWDDGDYLLPERGGLKEDEPWIVTQLKKLKQLSEVVAGPKWKNMLRKIGKFCKCKKNTAAQPQYSPESYALNFSGDREEDDDLLNGFSTRFAPITDQQRRGGL